SRLYEPADVPFAEQIAQRAAFAIDNAQLYAETRRAVQTRDEVLGIVAHDLRSPLGAILMQAEILRTLAVDPEGRSRTSTDSIERSARRMNRLIQDLLDVARLEEGALVVGRAPLSAAEVIADAVAAQEALARASSLDLELDLPRDLPELL